MKKTVERTLFWFSDGDNELLQLNERYFSISTLLNRLLCDSYTGKKIQYINIYFRTEETYKLHPQAPKRYTHFYEGHLNYDDVFDLSSFVKMTEIEQDEFVWKRAFEVLKEASIVIKNDELLKSSEYAYRKGLEIKLNPDYRMVEKDIILFGKPMKAAVWVNFKKDGMYSKFTLEKESEVIFEKEIDKTKNGIEFFLEIYKDIAVIGNDIILEGRKDVEYLPLRITINEEKLNY